MIIRNCLDLVMSLSISKFENRRYYYFVVVVQKTINILLVKFYLFSFLNRHKHLLILILI